MFNSRNSQISIEKHKHRNIFFRYSSAASTSSVSSTVDHWVSRMPRFVPPKHLKLETAATNNKVNNETTKETTDKENIDVALRNSQNALKTVSNNSIPKFIDENADVEMEQTNCSDGELKKKIFT